jgi:hypothetical protein
LLQHTSIIRFCDQKLETEPPEASGVVFMSGDSAIGPSKADGLSPVIRLLALEDPAWVGRSDKGSAPRVFVEGGA